MKAPPLEQVDLDRLRPSDDNPRTHSSKQIKALAASIKRFGFLTAIVVDAEGVIVAGEGRYYAALKLGLHTVPVLRASHLDADELRAYRLADNRLGEHSSWDSALLAIEIEHLVNIDFDVDLTGFSTGEADLLIGNAHVVDEPGLPELDDSGGPVSQPGDLWHLGPHRLICGDCRDPEVVDQLMQGSYARLVFSDPPFNVAINGHVSGLGAIQHDEFVMGSGEMASGEFTEFLHAGLEQMSRVTTDGGLHVVAMDWRHVRELLSAARDLYEDQLNLCVWAKSNAGMGSLWRSQHELFFVFKVGTAPHVNNVELGKHGRYRTNVWQYAGMNTFGPERADLLKLHPTVKPVQLVADVILDVTKPKDIVLDGFCGSGTTLLAAEQVGRVGFGIELDPRYVDVTLQRWLALGGTTPIHSQSELTFSSLANERGKDGVGDL